MWFHDGCRGCARCANARPRGAGGADVVNVLGSGFENASAAHLLSRFGAASAVAAKYISYLFGRFALRVAPLSCTERERVLFAFVATF